MLNSYTAAGPQQEVEVDVGSLPPALLAVCSPFVSVEGRGWILRAAGVRVGGHF